MFMKTFNSVITFEFCDSFINMFFHIGIMAKAVFKKSKEERITKDISKDIDRIFKKNRELLKELAR